MKNITVKIFFVIGFLMLTVCYSVSENAYFFEKENTDALVELKKGGPYAQTLFSVIPSSKAAGQYQLKLSGEGRYENYDDARWEYTAEFRSDEARVTVLQSAHKVFDSDGGLLEYYRQNYDYDAGVLTRSKLTKNGDAIKEETYPLKGPTCDYITLIHFLRVYAAHYGEKQYEYFYLLSSEPKLYKVRFEYLGQEVLDLPLGRVESSKFQLKADMGPVTDLAAQMAPPTYVWYENRAPHRWLKYEGLESGFKSANIVCYVTDREVFHE